MGQNVGMKHIGIGNHDMTRLANCFTRSALCITVIGICLNVYAQLLNHFVQTAYLIRRQGFGGKQIKCA